MARGPAPLPKNILVMRGSEEANSREELGTPLRDLPDPPEYLKPAAKTMFHQVCIYTQNMGVLAESDVEVIARYSAVWDRWRTAEEHLKQLDSGYVEVLAPDGSLRFSRPNKWMTQANSSHEQLRQLETVLGLTPADRTRLGYGAVKVVSDPVDELFGDTAAG
jgi:P27 family predicted phage terminase small subunit